VTVDPLFFLPLFGESFTLEAFFLGGGGVPDAGITLSFFLLSGWNVPFSFRFSPRATTSPGMCVSLPPWCVLVLYCVRHDKESSRPQLLSLPSIGRIWVGSSSLPGDGEFLVRRPFFFDYGGRPCLWSTQPLRLVLTRIMAEISSFSHAGNTRFMS